MKTSGQVVGVYREQGARLRRAARRAAAALGLAAMLAAGPGCATARGPGGGAGRPASAVTNAAAFDLGFLAARDTDLKGNRRLRALGPLFERKTSDAGRTFTAVRPLFSTVNEADTGTRVRDYLWPLATSKEFLGQRTWRVLMVYGNDFDAAHPDLRYRFVVFPLLFTGRDKHGERYFAVFPLGGTINEFLGRDRIRFVLFPLYGYSTINDLETHSVLWPMVSRTVGGDVSRFRVFPFYGKSVNDDLWTKRFALWPLWSSVHYSYPSSTGDGYMIIPVYGHVKLTDQETWMVIPPFFRWGSSERMTKANLPWPFIQYSSGEIDKLYVWPLWGYRSYGDYSHSFLFWPLVNFDREAYRDYALRRFSVLPVFYYESRIASSNVAAVPPPAAPASAAPARGPVTEGSTGIETNHVPLRYVNLWPLASYLREGDESRIRCLALWPLRWTPAIEKNLAPYWTLYSHTRVGAATEQELLWGLFRHRHDASGGSRTSVFPLFSQGRSDADEVRQWSALLGLVGYRREGSRKTLRLLYLLHVGIGAAKLDSSTEAASP